MATDVHEIVPRSKRPKDWNTEDNRIYLCRSCHVMVHSSGYKAFEKKLRECRDLVQ